MARSVILKGSPRCNGCQLPPRWCICDGIRAVESPLKVDVLMHHMEAHRPSSTGHLIKRVVAGADVHIYRRERQVTRAEIAPPPRELWILHPLGETMPADADPSAIRALVLDGTWRQSGDMMRATESWGRRIALPMSGESRYWLRTQAGENKFCTVEALIFMLGALGLTAAASQLRLQFELHVYAGLCARGAKAMAGEYLADSPVRAAFPELLEKLARRRARDDFPGTAPSARSNVEP